MDMSFTDMGQVLSEASLRRKAEKEALLEEEEDDDEEDYFLEGEDAKELARDELLAQEMESAMNSRKRIKKRKKGDQFFKGSTSVKLPPEIAAIMGKGNIAFVGRNYPDAILHFQQVIQAAPQAFEPYYTLGLIYEELGMDEKTMGYMLIAAHLAPMNGDLWKKVGMLSKKRNLDLQAIYCFKKATSANPDDLESFWERISLLMSLDKKEMARTALTKAISSHHPKNAEMLREVAAISVQMGQVEEAVKIFEKIINQTKAPFDEIDFSMYNMLIELYQMTKQYDRIMDIFQSQILWKCAVLVYPDSLLFKFSSEVLQDQALIAHVPIELLGKYLIACIKEERLLHLQVIEYTVMSCCIEDYGDVLFAVGGAYFEKGTYSAALSYFELLLSNPDLYRRDLWFRSGVCMEKLGNIEESLDCFNNELELFPDNDQCRLVLAKQYEAVGRTSEATAIAKLVGMQVRELEKKMQPLLSKTLKTESDNEIYLPSDDSDYGEEGDEQQQLMSFKGNKRTSKSKQNQVKKRSENPHKVHYSLDQCKEMRILYEKANFLFELKDISSFLSVSTNLITDMLNNEFVYARQATQTSQYLCRIKRPASKEEYLYWDDLLNTVYADISEEEIPTDLRQGRISGLHGLEVDEWLDLFQRHIEALVKVGDASSAASAIKRFFETHVEFTGDRGYRCQLLVLMLGVGLALKRPKIAKDAIFALIAYDRETPLPYALYKLVIAQNSHEFLLSNGHKRFSRSAVKYPTVTEISLIAGQIYALTRSYREAIDMYSSVLKQNPSDVISLLSMGISHINYAMSRAVPRRNYHVMLGFSLLFKYHQISGKTQESFYNLARAFHQLNIKHLALNYYERALEMAPSPGSNSDLRFECAYNLSLLYMAAGSPLMAQSITNQYLII